MDRLPLAVVSSLMHTQLSEYVSRTKEDFCRNFALISRFAGWTWKFKEITMDDILYNYDSIVNECYRIMDKMTDNHLNGENYCISVGTGRMVMHIVYYVNSHSVIVNMTVDIGS